MAWPSRREDDKPEFDFEKEFGIGRDELKRRLESSVSKEDYDALKAETDGTKSTLSELQERLNSLTNPQRQDDPVDPTTEMITDPAGFIGKVTNPTLQLAMQAQADLQEMKARQKYSEIFAESEDEIMESLKGFNLQTRSQPNFWEIHMSRFIGGKALKGELRAGSYPSLMGAGSASGSSSGGDPNLGLSADEIEYAAKRGIKKEKYAMAKKLVASGEKITLESAKKMGMVNG